MPTPLTHSERTSSFSVLAFYSCLFFLPDSGNTSGLLGSWDGDKDQEFLLPNGTFLDTNSSQKRIHHEFGQHCKIFVRY